MKESDSDSDKLDELVKLLRQLDKRRGLSVQQVLGLLLGSLFLVFVFGVIGISFLGTLFGPIAASVFTAMVIMFLYEEMRSSNVTKRSKYEEATEEEEQDTLDEFGKDVSEDENANMKSPEPGPPVG